VSICTTPHTQHVCIHAHSGDIIPERCIHSLHSQRTQYFPSRTRGHGCVGHCRALALCILRSVVRSFVARPPAPWWFWVWCPLWVSCVYGVVRPLGARVYVARTVRTWGVGCAGGSSDVGPAAHAWTRRPCGTWGRTHMTVCACAAYISPPILSSI